MKRFLSALILSFSIFHSQLSIAAPTFDAVNIDVTNATATPTVSLTVGGGCANPIIVASLAWYDSGGIGSVSSFSIGGSAATFINGVSPGSAGVNRRIEMWRRAGVSTGANTVTATFNSAKEIVTIAAVSYCGVHQTTSIGTSATYDNNGNDALATVNVSSAADELVVDAVMSAGGTTTLTAGAGQTQRVNDTSHGSFKSGASDETGSGATTMSWTSNTDDYLGIIAVPLKPAAVGGPSVARRTIVIIQ